MKRILVYGMSDNRGGIESYVMNVYRNLDKSKLIFDFVVDFPAMAYSDETEACGSKIYKIPAKSKNPIGQIFEFLKLLKAHPEYECVYFNILNAGAAFSMIAPRILRRKIIVHCHNNSDDNMLLHRIFKPFVNKFAQKKLACSRLAAEFMFNNTDEVYLINNAIDIKPFAYDFETRQKLRKEYNLDGKNVVIHVGRMAPQKNPFFLLDIIKEMCNICPETVMLYVGAGPLEQEVKQYAKDIEVFQNIIFLGMREDVSALLNSADIFLLPSKYEGFGIVLLEAQTNGLRCFTSKSVVPDETNINGLVNFIELDKKPSVWAEEIIKAPKSDSREKYANSLKNSGFVIEDTIEELEKIFY